MRLAGDLHGLAVGFILLVVQLMVYWNKRINKAHIFHQQPRASFEPVMVRGVLFSICKWSKSAQLLFLRMHFRCWCWCKIFFIQDAAAYPALHVCRKLALSPGLPSTYLHSYKMRNNLLLPDWNRDVCSSNPPGIAAKSGRRGRRSMPRLLAPVLAIPFFFAARLSPASISQRFFDYPTSSSMAFRLSGTTIRVIQEEILPKLTCLFNRFFWTLFQLLEQSLCIIVASSLATGAESVLEMAENTGSATRSIHKNQMSLAGQLHLGHGPAYR